MIDERHLLTIFSDALNHEAGTNRTAYLDEACGNDPELRARIDALLRAHENVDQFLEPKSTSMLDAAANPQPDPQFVGRYKLLELIGEGGMGSVWMAQQTEPVKRLVAVKLIKTGMDSKQVLARFEAERQALALMDHPNIARVLDAGTTNTGRPYFVMDLVKGVTITRYCDENHLTPRQRLELFIPVCQAVQHAHQKGIIHRDLKPSNVLVALYDDRPVPKVIDFGVAKATGKQLTEETLHTGFGAVVGTVEYMSPEQASLNQLDVDTRSDIYSLGVLLYELLTGSPPFTRTEMEKAGMLEMLRMIREQEPSKPSTKLSTANGLPTLAANRGTEPAKLTKLIRGELDWIVMKSLEKDRNRRYETANNLAIDVQRHLANEPVQACPPSAGYRLRKFARRNMAVMMTVACVVTMLIIGTLISTWLAIRAINAEELAQIRLAAETKAHTEAVTARNQAMEAQDRAEKNHARAQSHLNRSREAIHQITLVAQNRLAGVAQMESTQRELLEKALQFYLDIIRHEGDDPEIRRETAMAYGRAAEIYGALGHNSKAEEYIREAIGRFEKISSEPIGTPDDRAALVSYYNGFGFYARRRQDEVVAKQREAIRLAAQLVNEFPDKQYYKLELARSYSNLGHHLIAVEPEASEGFIRLALDLTEEMGAQYANASASLDLGVLLTYKGNPEGERWIRQAIAIWEKESAQSENPHPRSMVARSLSELGCFLQSRDKAQDAAESFSRSVELWTALVKDYPTSLDNGRELIYSTFQLSQALSAIGEDERAANAYQTALNRTRQFPQDAELNNQLAWLLATCQDIKFRDSRRAVEMAKMAVELDPQKGGYWNTLGVAQYRAGDWAAAIAALEKSMQIRSGGNYLDWLFLAMCHWQLGERNEARKWYDRAVEWTEQKKLNDYEWRRFRAEAAELLRVNQE